MARPESNNVDYFPHPTKHGKKMFYIENKYKNDGYSVWFKILEELGDANFHYLNLKDQAQLMYLSSRCNISVDLLINIINDLVVLGEFNKQLWTKEKILFSDKFLCSVSQAYEKRKNKCLHLPDLIPLLKSLGVLKPGFRVLKGDGNPQSKVKESKVKESKENKDVYFLYLLPENFAKNGFVIHWKNFVDHRKEIKRSLNERSAKMAINKLSKMDSPDKVINQTIENSWTGLFKLKDDFNVPGKFQVVDTKEIIYKSSLAFLDDWRYNDLTLRQTLSKFKGHKYFKEIKTLIKKENNITVKDMDKKYNDVFNSILKGDVCLK